MLPENSPDAEGGEVPVATLRLGADGTEGGTVAAAAVAAVVAAVVVVVVVALGPAVADIEEGATGGAIEVVAMDETPMATETVVLLETLSAVVVVASAGREWGARMWSANRRGSWLLVLIASTGVSQSTNMKGDTEPGGVLADKAGSRVRSRVLCKQARGF